MTEAPPPPGIWKAMAGLPPRVLSTEIYHPPRVSPGLEVLSGHTIAWGPFVFQGARLVRFADGAVRLLLPGHGASSRVIVKDRAVKAAIFDAVIAAVNAAGLPLATVSQSEISEHEHS